MKKLLAIILATAISLSSSAAYLPYPDIFVYSSPSRSNVSLTPGIVQPGDMVTIDWKVDANASFGIPEDPPPPQFPPAYGPWYDGIYLSGPDDVLLDTVVFDGILSAGQQYERSMQFQIPLDITLGDYRVYVHADYYGELTEQDESNNVAAAKGRLQIVPEPTSVALLTLGGFAILGGKRQSRRGVRK